MVFVGVSNPPAGNWPSQSYTVITNTPLIREKPYLSIDTNGNYSSWCQSLKPTVRESPGSSGPTPGVSIPISQFYLAQPGVDNAGTSMPR